MAHGSSSQTVQLDKEIPLVESHVNLVDSMEIVGIGISSGSSEPSSPIEATFHKYTLALPATSISLAKFALSPVNVALLSRRKVKSLVPLRLHHHFPPQRGSYITLKPFFWP